MVTYKSVICFKLVFIELQLKLIKICGTHALFGVSIEIIKSFQLYKIGKKIHLQIQMQQEQKQVS